MNNFDLTCGRCNLAFQIKTIAQVVACPACGGPVDIYRKEKSISKAIPVARHLPDTTENTTIPESFRCKWFRILADGTIDPINAPKNISELNEILSEASMALEEVRFAVECLNEEHRNIEASYTTGMRAVGPSLVHYPRNNAERFIRMVQVFSKAAVSISNASKRSEILHRLRFAKQAELNLKGLIMRVRHAIQRSGMP